MNYDFSQLNDKEFEILVADLLSSHYGERIERFKPGRDGGVDGRFYSDKDGEIILQCKHYLKTGYKALISKLKSEEAQKVNKLKPKKYIFITSLPLSRADKKEIKKIFSPYIKRENDIFGQEDINDLLVKNPQIEESHFKLWISSTTVFNRIINNAIKGRSEFELEQIQKKSFKYVQTETYVRAIDILTEKHVLIISGEPGIGKTTLAENICLYFASKGFEFIDIEESLSEAENIYTRGKKQIFYFDDFLGSNYFEAITDKKDSHIIKFIERVKNDKTKLFVLTSRTNILNSGVHHSNLFINKAIRNDEFLLSIRSLSQIDRARILYNHIWFSDLTEEYIDELYKNRRYRKIIDHQNYNPRLVEFITDVNRISEFDSTDYWEYIDRTLCKPRDIWENSLNIQSSEFVRTLVNLTVFNGGQITESELKAGFNRFVQLAALRNTSNTEKGFRSTAELATASFLRRDVRSDRVVYSLFNPSISDFVLNEYSQEIEKLIDIFRSLGTVQSLRELVSLGQEGVITQIHMNRLKNSVFEEALNGDYVHDYLIIISDLVRADERKRQGIQQLMSRIIRDPTPILEFSKFLSLLTSYHDGLQFNDYGFLISVIGDRNLDESEINDFGEFLTVFDVNDENILNVLTIKLDNFIFAELHSTELNLSDFVEIYYQEDVIVDFFRDHIEDELSNIAQSIVDGFQLDIFSKLDIQIDDIVSEIDIDEMVDEYINSQAEPDYEDYRDHDINIDDQDIDDLFERD